MAGKIENFQNIEYIKKLVYSYNKFIPLDILNLLKKNNITEVNLGDQIEKKLTILFTDIRDFTTISESLSPKENFEFINSYLSPMVNIIREHNGIIDKFIGDAIMAIFPTNADDALKCSLSMLKQLRLYNKDRENNGHDRIKIGIGLNTGLSMLGIIGGFNRMEMTVISDAVNFSSRLETLTKTYKVELLISEHTYHNLNNANNYSIRFIDRVLVKGKKQPESVYEVFDEDESKNLKIKTKLLFEDALSNYHYKNIEKAKNLLNKCIKINQDDKPAKVYLEKCENFLKTGKFEGATELNRHVEWGKDWEINIDEIDEQHKKLVCKSYEIIELVKNNKISEVLDLVDYLYKYTKFHFKTEEKYMVEHKYPFLEHQKMQHEKFLIALEHLKEEISSKNISRIYLMFRLQILWIDWLINHTQKEDKHFGKFLKYKK